METGQYICPGCSGRLMVSPIEGFRHYVCASCAGEVITIAVLRQLARSVAQEIWTEEPGPPGTGEARCPFCTREMEPKPVATGTAATCRACESVWLSKDAAAAVHVAVPATGAPNEPTLSSETLRCPQCGAPVSNSWDEKCEYCGTGLHAPVKVIVMPEGTDGDGPLSGRHVQPTVLGEVLGAFWRGRP